MVSNHIFPIFQEHLCPIILHVLIRHDLIFCIHFIAVYYTNFVIQSYFFYNTTFNNLFYISEFQAIIYQLTALPQLNVSMTIKLYGFIKHDSFIIKVQQLLYNLYPIQLTILIRVSLFNCKLNVSHYLKLKLLITSHT